MISRASQRQQGICCNVRDCCRSQPDVIVMTCRWVERSLSSKCVIKCCTSTFPHASLTFRSPCRSGWGSSRILISRLIGFHASLFSAPSLQRLWLDISAERSNDNHHRLIWREKKCMSDGMNTFSYLLSSLHAACRWKMNVYAQQQWNRSTQLFSAHAYICRKNLVMFIVWKSNQVGLSASNWFTYQNTLSSCPRVAYTGLKWNNSRTLSRSLVHTRSVKHHRLQQTQEISSSRCIELKISVKPYFRGKLKLA